jgi:hypothetical protein
MTQTEYKDPIANKSTGKSPIEHVLELLPGAKLHGKWYNTACPSHHDRETSFGFTENDTGGVIFKCFAGCSREHILTSLNLTEDDIREKNGQRTRTRAQAHISLWDLAVDKNIDPRLLTSYGLTDGYMLQGKQVIRIPYYLENGEEHTLAHVRFNLVAKKGTRADGTGNLIPYGLNRLEDARKAGYLIVAEGESDCWTFWRFNFPALGIPGASNFNTIHADMLQGIDRVYIIQELTDAAGKAFPEKVAKRLTETGYKRPCLAVPLLTTHDVKDPNALLQKLFKEGRINAFKDEMQRALDAATPIALQQADTHTQQVTLDTLQPMVLDAIEKQDVNALYDLAENIASLDTKGQGTLKASIQTGMKRCDAFSWLTFKKLMQEAQTKIKQAQREEKIYVSGRPQIRLGRQLREEGDDALSALYKANIPPEIYIRGGKLARVRLNEKHTPMIETMTDTMLIERLTRVADFVTYNEQKDSYSSTHPTTKIANYILDQTRWLFPPLEGIVESPVLRSDGTILDTSGYDDQTQLCYMPSKKMKRCSIPLSPTQKDVKRSVSFILSTIEDFPFETEADRANMVAALLTPVIRPAITGDVQMTLLDATKPGTGKGFLSHLIAMVATGKHASPIGLPETDDELEKRIGAKLMFGSTLVIIDNVSRKLQSSALELILTAGGEQEVRILGQSKMMNVSTRATWVITGNNIQLGGDLARRCYRIRLVSPVSNPDERRDFKIENFLTWIEEHRPDLITSLLILARAWFIAGKPNASNVPHLASFTDWAKTVGGILEYAGIKGFQENRAELKAEANTEEGQWENFLLAWDACFRDNWISASKLVEKIKECSENTKELPANLQIDDGSETNYPQISLWETLPDTLKIALQEKPNGFTIKLARALEKRIKTPYGKKNIRIERQENKHTKSKEWRVVQVVAGSYSNATRTENDFSSYEEKEKNKFNGYSMVEQTTCNYLHLEVTENTDNISSQFTGSSMNFSIPESVAGSENQPPANKRTYDDDLFRLEKKLHDQVSKTEINPFWKEITGQSPSWKNGPLPPAEWVERFKWCLYSENVSLVLNAQEELEKRLAL